MKDSRTVIASKAKQSPRLKPLDFGVFQPCWNRVTAVDALQTARKEKTLIFLCFISHFVSILEKDNDK